MKKVSYLHTIVIFCFSFLEANAASSWKISPAEQNLTQSMHFAISEQNNTKHLDNIHLNKHLMQWHLSFENNKDKSTLSNQDFQSILTTILSYIAQQYPTITPSKIRLSSALVDEVWQDILVLSVSAMQKEHGAFSLRERGKYAKSLEYSFEHQHPFVQEACQTISQHYPLYCEKTAPVQIHNTLFKEEFMIPRMTWESLQKLKEKAFDRKSQNISYLRFNLQTRKTTER